MLSKNVVDRKSILLKEGRCSVCLKTNYRAQNYNCNENVEDVADVITSHYVKLTIEALEVNRELNLKKKHLRIPPIP